MAVNITPPVSGDPPGQDKQINHIQTITGKQGLGMNPENDGS